MTFFPHSKNIQINGGTFSVIENKKHRPEEKGWSKLCESIAHGAFHNCGERHDAPKCHPGTREAIIDNIIEWTKGSHSHQLFLWLYGPAGAGKSAIADTIAKLCYDAGILMASFFFSRTAPGRNNEKLFISSLAYQLCVAIPEMRDLVGIVVDSDPAILSGPLQIQFQKLVLEPFNKVVAADEYGSTLPRRLIIIDGLDECATAKIQRDILDTLILSARQFESPLCFLVASRPDYAIQQKFNAKNIRSMMFGLALDDNYHRDDDILAFLLSKFETIRQEHPLGARLPTPWPRPVDLDTLVKKASGQFIYASTVSRYVESPRRRPEESLSIILGLLPPQNSKPFQELDALYHQILQLAEDRDRVLEVLSLAILNVSALPFDRSFIEGRLGYQEGDLDIILYDMRALVNYEKVIRLYHASLSDFLLDFSRSGPFFVDVKKGHANLACKFLRFCLRGDLKVTSRLNKASETVCEDALRHCAKGHLNPELRDVLQIPDTAKILSKACFLQWHERLGVWDQFICWLQIQHESHKEDNLLKRYLQCADDRLRDMLFDFPDAIRSHLSVALMFPSFYQSRADFVLELLTQDMTPLDFAATAHGDDVWGLFLRHRGSLPLVTMFCNFLSDPTRSRELFVTPEKYNDLAEKLLGYLSRRRKADPSIPRTAFSMTVVIPQLLGYIIPGALPSASLALHLQNELLQYNKWDSLLDQREETAIVALTYLEGYDISYEGHTHDPETHVCWMCQ